MTEYGARLPVCRVVYMKDTCLETVAAWIAEYSAVTPLELVTRECIGESHGSWH